MRNNKIMEIVQLPQLLLPQAAGVRKLKLHAEGQRKIEKERGREIRVRVYGLCLFHSHQPVIILH